MSNSIEVLRTRLAATAEARGIVNDLRQRGQKVALAVEVDSTMTDEDREGLMVVLGGIAVMVECIESAIRCTGSAIDLAAGGMLRQARASIALIDEVLA